MAKHTVISKDGTVIAYDISGHGPVVILVLGALNSRKSGVKLAKLLAPHFTLISYDRRGRGDSTDVSPYSPDREVEDLAAIIDEVGGPVYLYGHSSGGAVAIAAALEMPKQIKKLAVYEVPYTQDAAAGKVAEAYNKKLKSLISDGRKGDAVAVFMQYIGMSDKQVQAMKRLPMWRGLEALAPTLVYDSEVLGEGHALPKSRLAGITTPTLVMAGGSSPEFMQNVAESLGKAIPKAQHLTLSDQTHGVKPTVMAPVLVDFFS